MHFSANESIVQQRIAELHADAEVRRRVRARPVVERPGKQVRGVREALGYRLVVLGWRLLDTNPRLAHRPLAR
jgi:hypothetical protein